MAEEGQDAILVDSVFRVCSDWHMTRLAETAATTSPDETIALRHHLRVGDEHHMIIITREAIDLIAGGAADKTIIRLVEEYGDLIDHLGQLLVAQSKAASEPKHLMTAGWISRSIDDGSVSEASLAKARHVGEQAYRELAASADKSIFGNRDDEPQIWEDRWWEEQAKTLEWHPIDTYVRIETGSDGGHAVMLRSAGKMEFGAWDGKGWCCVSPDGDHPLAGFEPTEWADVSEETRIQLLTP